MPGLNIVLTDHEADLIHRLVGTGRYQNAIEVLREGLRLIESRELEERARLSALREAAQVGIADIAAGRFGSFETAGSLERHLEALASEVIGAKRTRKRSR